MVRKLGQNCEIRSWGRLDRIQGRTIRRATRFGSGFNRMRRRAARFGAGQKNFARKLSRFIWEVVREWNQDDWRLLCALVGIELRRKQL
jgi:hypothetical protein